MKWTEKLRFTLGNLGFVGVVLLAFVAVIASFLAFALFESLGFSFGVSMALALLGWPLFAVAAALNVYDLKENPK